MKQTRMPSANLVANSGNTIYGVSCYMKFWTNVVCWLIVGEVSILAFTCMEAMTLFVNAAKSRGGTPKKLTGCAARVFATIPQLGYRDRGPKSYLWLRKMGQNQILDNRKCHQINYFWSNFAWNWSNLSQIFSIEKKCGIRSKWTKFAENIPLATESEPKLGNTRDIYLWYSNAFGNKQFNTTVAYPRGQWGRLPS